MFQRESGGTTGIGQVTEKIVNRVSPTIRDEKLDGLQANVDKHWDMKPEAAKLRQDKICEAIGIMQLAESGSWLNIRPAKIDKDGANQPGSKTRYEIIDTVCKTVMSESISIQDFQALFGPSFASSGKEMIDDQHYQLDIPPARRMLLIKATEQFLAYAQAKPDDKTAQERAAVAVDAIARVAEGKLNPRLDKGHINHARTEAASLLAGRDILKHRKALEAYFGEKSIGQADKLQVVMDLELKTMGETKALARMIKALCEKGISAKLQLALVSKVETGLNKTMTDDDIWDTRSTLKSDSRNRDEYIKQEGYKAREKILEDISSNLLGAKYTSEQTAAHALLVMSRAFPGKPVLALAEDINPAFLNESRTSNMADLSPAVIKAIPSFLLDKHPLSESEKESATAQEKTALTLGFEPKRRMDEEQIKLGIRLIMDGLNKLMYQNSIDIDEESVATYLEMLISLRQKLPRDQRGAIGFTSTEFFNALSQKRDRFISHGSRISKAQQRLTIG